MDSLEKDILLRDNEPVTGDSQQKQWQLQFPYHWDTDALESRRNLLLFAIYTSGTLFLGTGLLALLGRLQSQEKTAPVQIAWSDQLAPGEALYFNYPGPKDQAVLLHLDDGRFVAYSQTCTHLSCSVYYQQDRKRLFCPCHEGVFNPSTGEPVAGPPVRPLPRIKLQTEGTRLYAIGVEP
jgi:Rieske Fe-S protein